jgi:hypothetical protein
MSSSTKVRSPDSKFNFDKHNIIKTIFNNKYMGKNKNTNNQISAFQINKNQNKQHDRPLSNFSSLSHERQFSNEFSNVKIFLKILYKFIS